MFMIGSPSGGPFCVGRRPPTVEPAFYAVASSPLLPAYRSLGDLGPCSAMAFERIDAPMFELFPAVRGPLFDDWAAQAARELLA